MRYSKSLFPLVIAFLSACSLDEGHIRKYSWKNNGGYWPQHDVLFFGGGYLSLRNDTIFQFDSAVAVITGSRKGFYKINEIYVRELASGKESSYTELAQLKAQDTVISIRLSPPPADSTEPPPPSDTPKH